MSSHLQVFYLFDKSKSAPYPYDMPKVDVLIIGAGFVGSAVACNLADRGIKNIVVLEREEMPGMHASSQNASMMRQFEEDSVIASAAFKGAGFILTPPFHWGRIAGQEGSLIVFPAPKMEAIKKALDFSLALGLEAEILDKKEAVQKVPLLQDAEFDYAVWTMTDGVVDIHKFLWSYINDAKSAGVRFEMRQEVLDIRQKHDGSFVVTTERASFEARSIVNASGAWASEVGKMAGAQKIQVIPRRRHLYSTTHMKDVDPGWPFVWDIEHQYYFRPESGGLLLSPCDEDEVPPGIPSTSHLVREALADKLANYCPRLANVTIHSEWAGLRTFAPDRRFVVGRDSVLNNFYWAACLGGSGVTCCNVVGTMLADVICGGGKGVPEEFNPSRFL